MLNKNDNIDVILFESDHYSFNFGRSGYRGVSSVGN